MRWCTSETHDDVRGGVILFPTAIPHHPYFEYDLGSLRQHWAGPVDMFSALQARCPCGVEATRVQLLTECKRKIPRDNLFQMHLSGKSTAHLNPQSELTRCDIPPFCLLLLFCLTPCHIATHISINLGTAGKNPRDNLFICIKRVRG